MIHNLLDPTILCFAVGFLSGLVKSDLRLPKSTYDFVSLYLLLAIGFKGGVQLSQTNVSDFALALLITIILGVTIPLVAFGILRRYGKFSREDSGAIAAHYGSVSAVTFATAITFLQTLKVSYEPYITTLMVILEIPALCVGIYLARGGFKGVSDKGKLFNDLFFGKSIFLLGGGMLIGLLSGEQRMAELNPLFVDLFKGFLALFLLELGVVASHQFGHLKRVGVFLFAFAIFMPIISGLMGLILAYLINMSLGGATLLAILAASSSYIAAPSAMRIAVPEARPVFSLTASLAVTFPLNLTVGIPFFYWLATILYAA
jgi:uncharacterized protein